MEPSKPIEHPGRKLAFFTPRQMVYLVRHEDGLSEVSDDQIDGLIQWSNGLGGGARISARRVLRFPAAPRPEYPGIHAAELLPEKQYIRPKVEPRGPFALIFADVEGVEDLVELIRLLDRRRFDQPVLQLRLELVSPSWLASGASEQPGTGGPGGRPVPFQGQPLPTQHKFRLPPEIEALCPEEDLRGHGVEVAILDTAPCLHDLAAAYERYQKVNPQNITKRHPLIESLLRPDGPLHVHPASYDALLRMRSVHLEEHEYSMTDHGLFVAGIIHSIAPRAKLHLIEVLNPDGVGDLQSIAEGLDWVVQNLSNRPLVVNLSLVLNIPLEDGHPRDGLDPQLLIKDPAWLKRQGWPIEWICDSLYALRSRVIAASGNDREGTARPQARYPAAFDSAIGVGALPKLDKPPQTGGLGTASYSNFSDRPQKVGITTLGGEATVGVPRNERVTLEEKGVLGLYIGQFPPEPHSGRSHPNTNDWAWWCGTSFAAPIISGVTAAVLSGMSARLTTQRAIEELYNAQAVLTIDNEDVLFVTQG